MPTLDPHPSGPRGTTKRWWVPNTHPNERVVRHAIEWLDAVTPRGRSAAIVVETLKELHAGDVELVLGSRATQHLSSKRPLPLRSGGKLEVISMRGSFGGLRVSGPLLLVYAEDNHLEFADRIQGATEILAVPWQNSDVARWAVQQRARLVEWTSEWRCAEYRRSRPMPSANSGGLHLAADMALYELFGTFIGHDAAVQDKDRPLLIGLLALLRENGVPFTAEQIYAWGLTMDGGSSWIANDLARVARDVLSGHVREPAIPLWGVDSLMRWHEAVERFRAHAAQGFGR